LEVFGASLIPPWDWWWGRSSILKVPGEDWEAVVEEVVAAAEV
jgi:hypothetical protein